MIRDLKRCVATAALMTCATSGIAAAQPQPQPQPQPSTPADPQLDAALARMLAGESQTQGPELERLIAAAAAHPLGARQNPVRAAMPPGQRDYLSRLRCSDGRAPRFNRRGNIGPGVYGNIVDQYEVSCGRAAPGDVSIYMDMYHRGHVEQRAVPGFTIAAR